MPERAVQEIPADARTRCWTHGCGRWHSGIHMIDGLEVHSARCLECATPMYRRAWATEEPPKRQSGI